MAIIETKNLTKYYGSVKGIENLSMTVEEGEIFGFIGPNGAGKSTTIRTLLGLIQPTSGSATIFGRDIQTDGPAIREAVGYLPSEVFYYDNMRVRDLLEYSASFYKQPRAAMQARIRELATRLDLDLGRKIDDLSYGNKKKVGIVQGLLHSPKLIILDEPTGGLDPLMQATFFDMLREEHERGTTIVFSSHILSEVQRLCNRVAIIKEGELVTVEQIDKLRRNSYLSISAEFEQHPNPRDWQAAGMTNVHIDGNKLTLLYRGDVNTIVKRLSECRLHNVSIQEPELEDIFMHYYQKDQA